MTEARELQQPASQKSAPRLAFEVTSIGAVGLTLFVLLKTYAAAHYSLTTASALLTTAPLDVVLGTLTSYEYGVMPLLALGAWSWAVAQWKASGWSLMPVAVAAFGLLAFLLSPWEDLGFAVLGLAVFVAVRVGLELAKLAAAAGRRFAWPPLRHTVELYFVAAAFWIVLTTLPNLWLPVEVVVVQSSATREVVVGVVLTTDERWTTVVKAGNRQLVRYRSEFIESRQICHLSGAQPRGRGPLMNTWRKPYSSPNPGCQTLLNRMQVNPVAGSLPET